MAPLDESSRRFARINGTLLIVAGLIVFALVSRIPLREVWSARDVKGLVTAALGVIVGAVLVRSGMLVRRAGAKKAT